MATSELASLLEERFGDRGIRCTSALGEATVELSNSDLLKVCGELRDRPEFAFAQLVDLCAVDYLSYGRSDWDTSETATTTGFSRGVNFGAAGGRGGGRPRYAVVYHLLSHAHNRRLRLRVYAEGEPPQVDSVTEIWNAANWFEREAFDLFGILFSGHPDLRRILTDYGFIGHPFRKDFPLIGNVELRYAPDKQRVVYQPVTIEPRTLVPRVVREDSRYIGEGDAESGGGA